MPPTVYPYTLKGASAVTVTLKERNLDATLGVATLVGPGPTEDQPPVDPGGGGGAVRNTASVKTLCCLQEGGFGGVTSANLTLLGKRFDIITFNVTGNFDTPKTPLSADQIAAIKAAATAQGTTCLLLPYINGGTQPTANPLTDSWYALDTSGNKILNNDVHTSQQRYLMNQESVGYRGWLADRAASYVNFGFDGIFIDVMGLPSTVADPVVMAAGGVPNGTGGTLAQGVKYTTRAWDVQANLTSLAVVAAVKAVKSTALIIPNGLKYGVPYAGGSSGLVNGAVTGGMAEVFMRSASDAQGVHRNSDTWLKDLAMVQDMSARGKVLFVMDKILDNVNLTSPTNDETLRFGLGSMMLVNDGTHYLALRDGNNTLASNVPDWFWSTDYGTPSGAYTKNSAGIYFREFSKCTLVVNPTASSWTGTAGAQGSSVTVPAYQAKMAMKP